MRPRFVLLAGLAVVFSGCLVQPGEDFDSESNVDTESSALGSANPVLPASGDQAQPDQSATGGPISPFGKAYETGSQAADPVKPSPDPWGALNLSPATNSGVTVSPTTSKSGSN